MRGKMETQQRPGEEKQEKPLEAGGFLFYTEKDAELARQEGRKIQYLKAHMDVKNPDSIRGLYEKAIQERVFKTPVGLFFLKELQNYLVKHPGTGQEKLPPIPLFVPFEGEMRSHTAPARQRVQPAEEKKQRVQILPVSVCLNIALILAVIIMFAVTLTSDQPNILNYERALTDRYAGWEQELTEREQAVREAELELQRNP